MIESIQKEIYKLHKIYEKDKNVFNKIITLFNTHLQNSSLISLEDNLGRDLEILLSDDYLGTIIAYIGLMDDLNLDQNIDEHFLTELKYCSLLTSDLLLKSNRAKSNPIAISSIKCLSSDNSYVLMEVKRNDINSMVFEADIESLKGIKDFLENLISEITDSTNKNDGE